MQINSVLGLGEPGEKQLSGLQSFWGSAKISRGGNEKKGQEEGCSLGVRFVKMS